jgi:N-acetylglucosaminyl-diphospho-decaprenol L-rhamnosyltransferase
VPTAALPPALARRVDPWRGDQPRRVGWAVGSCVGGRTATLARLGPFDPEVFLYAEDLELGLRAADAGVETWFWPAARVRHHGAHATSKAFGGEAHELLAQRRREAVGRLRGTRRQRVDDALQATTFASRAAIKRLMRKPADRERLQLAALRRARRSDR